MVLCLILAGCEQAAAPRLTDGEVHRLAALGQTGPLLAALSVAGGVDSRDVCYRTPLMLAAQFGRLDTVRELLGAGARVDLHEKGYYTALMLAAGNGHTEVVRMLAEAGASLDEVEITRGWTALIWAARGGHVDTVALLLERGADPGQHDRQGRSAADWARAQGHSAVLALL
jgi:ankyrin repeat protein